MERDILKKSHRVPCEDAAAWYALMRTLRAHYPLSLLCRVLKVSRSGYYAWQHRRPSKRAQENARLEVAIQAELHADGFPAGIRRIMQLRKKLGLRCTQVRRFTTTTASNHALPVAENVLAQTFVATRPNETWLTNITYIPTGEGWLYVAGVKDLCTCEVVGYTHGGPDDDGLGERRLKESRGGETPRPRLDPPLRLCVPIFCSGLSGATAAARHDRVHESERELL